jgi:pimeloyl-ACP methyl ester carboxylesterase
MTAPTIVLVHGAFADGSSWNGVVEQLQHRGFTVVAPANPLRGVGVDSEYLASVVRQIDGPVLLVGHSYGGAVISNADVPNAVGLVFVAAFAPDADEVLGEVAVSSQDSILMSALVQRSFPAGSDTSGVELFVDPAKFRETFAADLTTEQAAVMAATQRPIAARAFDDVSGTPAWRRLPSWAVVATGDKAAGADLVRRLAERADADTIELEGSHVIMVSQPRAVAEHIAKAAEAVAASAA